MQFWNRLEISQSFVLSGLQAFLNVAQNRLEIRLSDSYGLVVDSPALSALDLAREIIRFTSELAFMATILISG